MELDKKIFGGKFEHSSKDLLVKLGGM